MAMTMVTAVATTKATTRATVISSLISGSGASEISSSRRPAHCPRRRTESLAKRGEGWGRGLGGHVRRGRLHGQGSGVLLEGTPISRAAVVARPGPTSHSLRPRGSRTRPIFTALSRRSPLGGCIYGRDVFDAVYVMCIAMRIVSVLCASVALVWPRPPSQSLAASLCDRRRAHVDCYSSQHYNLAPACDMVSAASMTTIYTFMVGHARVARCNVVGIVVGAPMAEDVGVALCDVVAVKQTRAPDVGNDDGLVRRRGHL